MRTLGIDLWLSWDTRFIFLKNFKRFFFTSASWNVLLQNTPITQVDDRRLSRCMDYRRSLPPALCWLSTIVAYRPQKVKQLIQIWYINIHVYFDHYCYNITRGIDYYLLLLRDIRRNQLKITQTNKDWMSLWCLQPNAIIEYGWN